MDPENYRFGLIGAAGYIAPRHMKAVQETGNELIAALDPNDSVGIIDSYFPRADFFIEPERFDRHLDKLRRKGDLKIDYLSICSPNFLHDAHIRMALRNNSHAICEKPVVLNPWNVEALSEIEEETGKNIYTILQLRLHPAIQKLKRKMQDDPCSNGKPDTKHDVDLTYITSRGRWYYMSWKGSTEKSGGIATNIGIHLFDMLGWIFGELQENTVNILEKNRACGYLEFEHARVRWFLSLDSDDLPGIVQNSGQRTYRSIKVDGDEVEFSGGFTDLHTQSYQAILDRKGFGLKDAGKSIRIVHDIRHAKPVGKMKELHPLVRS